jgi:hypothetical protein
MVKRLSTFAKACQSKSQAGDPLSQPVLELVTALMNDVPGMSKLFRPKDRDILRTDVLRALMAKGHPAVIPAKDVSDQRKWSPEQFISCYPDQTGRVEDFDAATGASKGRSRVMKISEFLGIQWEAADHGTGQGWKLKVS